MWPAPLLILCISILTPYTYAKPRGQCRIKPRQQAALSIAPPTSTSPATPATTTQLHPSGSASPAQSFPYGNVPIRGVNLGGWLLLEPWITPSIFEKTGNDDIVDEYTFGKLQDREKARQTLEQHWNTWITEDDFKAIKDAGLNHVRLPISYWAVPVDDTSVDPYISGAYPYMLKALDWAATHGIKVILDLHGAPGSQNGFDNSGQRTGDPQWALQPAHMSRTIDILRFLAKDVGRKVSCIELLNEVAGFRDNTWASAVRDFWSRGYKAIRDEIGYDVQIVIGDAFLGVNSWYDFLKPPAVGVLMDVHAYQIFSHAELIKTDDQHITSTCAMIQPFTDYASRNIWTFLGEWSAAPTDCTKWLNGRGVGARWDGTYPDSVAIGSCKNKSGSWKTFSKDYMEFLRKYWEAQVEVGERVQGWVYWAWKAENSDEWSYQKGLEAGWIPKDPNNRRYPDVCG